MLGPGDRLALRIDGAAAHPGAGQEREPADVAVLAGEDADVVATLARQARRVGPDGDRLVGLEPGQPEPPVGAAVRGPELLLVGNTPDRGPGDRTALQVDHQAGDRAGLRRRAAGFSSARPWTAQAIRTAIVRIVTDRLFMRPIPAVGKRTRLSNTARLSSGRPGIASQQERSSQVMSGDDFRTEHPAHQSA